MEGLEGQRVESVYQSVKISARHTAAASVTPVIQAMA